MKGDFIVGLDIGTTKIATVVGEVTEDGVDIIGVGTTASVGLKKGVVVNIDSTVRSIKKSVEQAEIMAGCEITSVYAGIAGSHIQSFNSHGAIGVKNREVTQSDKTRVVENATAVAIPMDREVIHTLVQEYIVDGQPGVEDPLGMRGVRLEGKVAIVTGAVTSAYNLIKCCNKAGLDVSDIVLQALASSLTALQPEERELGAAVIDFGGGTTDLAVFSKSAIKHTYVLGLGGNNLTHDLAVGLRTPVAAAETIKRRNGCCLTAMIPEDERIEVQTVGGGRPRVLGRQILGQILEPRVEELFGLINQELGRAGMRREVVSGVVVTGGSSLLPGIPELGEQVFSLPVRLGYPGQVGGLTEVVSDPAYATAVGLTLYGAEHRGRAVYGAGGVLSHVLDRMKRWFRHMNIGS